MAVQKCFRNNRVESVLSIQVSIVSDCHTFKKLRILFHTSTTKPRHVFNDEAYKDKMIKYVCWFHVVNLLY